MTICNMSIEAGAKAGMIAPDETTFAYVEGRKHAPKGAEWERALDDWRSLVTDEGATFDREVVLDAAAISPHVSWGTNPGQVISINGVVPDPERLGDDAARESAARALAYMNLRPGTPMREIPVDTVFIGSCTNSRIEDLRAAAAVLAGRVTKVPGLVSPGSSPIKAQAEQEGLDRIFTAAGLEWADSGCSMCVGMNGDLVASGERCASTTNRNFKGRQGAGARTHLMSPAMVAAAAVTGAITDVRPLLAGRT